MLILLERFLRKSSSSKKGAKEQALSPEETVSEIIKGDESKRDALIANYSPYIAKLTSKFCRRYIDPKKDDEFSIALLAFNEAIDSFNAGAGKSFLGFAKTVIQRRLIDYARKEKKHRQDVPYSVFDYESDDGAAYNVLETRQSIAAHEAGKTESARRSEIAELSSELGRYGITFAELVELSPKHSDSRVMLISIAIVLAENGELMEQLRATGKLPVKELMEVGGVSRKTIERNRKYLIAIAIIKSGNYPYMNDYLRVEKSETETLKEVSR
ncbi:RNA polymerase sigma factor SigI [Paenibacillus sp. CAU 1782]